MRHFYWSETKLTHDNLDKFRQDGNHENILLADFSLPAEGFPRTIFVSASCFPVCDVPVVHGHVGFAFSQLVIDDDGIAKAVYSAGTLPVIVVKLSVEDCYAKNKNLRMTPASAAAPVHPLQSTIDEIASVAAQDRFLRAKDEAKEYVCPGCLRKDGPVRRICTCGDTVVAASRSEAE